MTNSADERVSQIAPSSPVPPPPVPTSESPAAAPVTGAPSTAASTEIATNSSVNVGGSRSGLGILTTDNTEIVINLGTHARGSPSGEVNPTTAGTGIVANLSASVGGSSCRSTVIIDANSPPRKRGNMLNAGEGRSVKQNVAPAPALPLIPLEKRTCSVCKRVFDTVKALFRHMNSHPNLGWKGAHPPPAFNRQEFVDLQAKTEQVAGDPAPPSERPNALPDLNTVESIPAAAAAEPVYRLPDLNLLPPSEEEEEDKEE